MTEQTWIAPDGERIIEGSHLLPTALLAGMSRSLMNTSSQVIRGLLVLILVTTFCVSQAWSQPGGRGGRDDGEDGGRRGRRGGPGMMQGGPGGPPGMMRGGGPGGPPGMMPGGPGMGRGGPPGDWGGRGGRSGRGGGDAMGFLSRMDRNGNGMLDPDEAQGPARMMLDRMAGPANLDLSKPIPLDDVNKAFQQMREERMQEGFSRWGGRGGNDDDDDNRRGGGAAEIEPLVPGFGEPDLFDPVPGFGDQGERFAVKIEQSDEEDAQRTLGRYDRNRDGVLDQGEMRWARELRGDPLETDRNRDGQLSLNELALRFAVHRADEQGGGSNSRSSRGRTSSSRSSNRSSSRNAGDNDERMKRMVDGTMNRYDRNRNGVLEKDEWSSFRTDPSGADKNSDSRITRDELGDWMASRYGGGGRGGRGGGGSSNGASAATVTNDRWGDRKSYRSASATARLPEGLPEWYARTDGNGDGQIMMSEYAVSWSNRVAEDFAQFDRNGDGVITPEECLAAVEAGAVQGVPQSNSSSSGSFATSRPRRSYSRPATTPTPAPAESSQEPETSSPAASTADGSAPPKYVKYAVGLIKRYDTNGDGVLTKDEWSSMTNDYSSADADQDGRITPTELAKGLMK
jgi:Ca2+-binding EF-hand superfamily protein